MCFIPAIEKRTVNSTYADAVQLISSKTGIILLHSGFHYDSMIAEYVPPFDMPWPDLREYNPFLNDMYEHL